LSKQIRAEGVAKQAKPDQQKDRTGGDEGERRASIGQHQPECER